MAVPEVYTHTGDVPPDLLSELEDRPLPQRVLMCPPTHFDVCEVHNPFMEESVGKVDFDRAEKQWGAVKEAFERAGAQVSLLEPLESAHDMVFCANPTLAGLDEEGERLCILSQMTHPSRHREVGAVAAWFEQQGYRIEPLLEEFRFEGGGDAVWHPGKALLWGGHGFRSEADSFDGISDFFGVPVLLIELRDERFYHLDTALCAVNPELAMIVPSALGDSGCDLVRTIFKEVIEVDESEALLMACNAAAVGGDHVILQAGAEKTASALAERGITVHSVDASEFLKSGGGIYCMKSYVF